MAAVSLTAAMAFLVIIVRSGGEPAAVATQGSLYPGVVTAAGTAVLGAGSSVPTTAPASSTSITIPVPITPLPTPPTTAPRPSTTVRRLPPPAPVPTIPAPLPEPPPAPAPAPAPGFRVVIDRIGVDAPVVAVGVEEGTNAMEIPGLDDVGWYRYSSMPGESVGTAVLVGHVDGNGRPGVFSRLRDLTPGDRFSVGRPDGRVQSFEVTGLQEFSKQALPTDLFARQGPGRVALITCGGAFDRATGHYLDNVVVVAAPVA